MFKYLPLLWANLKRKRLRTSLTLASIVIAFLLFGMLRALQTALTGSADLAGVDRLITMHKVSFIQPLPLAYLNRIRGIEGVRAAGTSSWFGGVYQEDRNQIAVFATEPENFFQLYTEYDLPAEQIEAWKADRASAIVGIGLAEKFGWKLGQTIPMRSNIFTKKDGGNVWDLKIAGIYDASNGDNNSVYFNYDYFNESRSFGRDTIGMVSVRLKDPDQAPEIAKKIDAMFANSPTETKTNTERAFMQSFAAQMGNIGALVTGVAAAVFFTMLLVTANTMGQSIRERINEIAVMKTLGFSSFGVTALVFGEALLVTAIGGVIGLGLAAMLAGMIAKVMSSFFPVLGLGTSTIAWGAVLIVVLGTLAAALPSAQAWRLKIVDALRRS
jgi:putative ABC transport system permease protein